MKKIERVEERKKNRDRNKDITIQKKTPHLQIVKFEDIAEIAATFFYRFLWFTCIKDFLVMCILPNMNCKYRRNQMNYKKIREMRLEA